MMDGGRFEPAARVGPNAVLQLVPVLDAAIGPERRQALFRDAGIALPPPDAGMLPEPDVARFHRVVCAALPDLAPQVMREAGLATADYILANRIPRPARLIIRSLPKPLGARLLSGAIAKHAWTFAGSGRFQVEGFRPLTLSIAENPLAMGSGERPRCHWHAGVFERLFQRLVWPDARVAEDSCCAAGDTACRFRISPHF